MKKSIKKVINKDGKVGRQKGREKGWKLKIRLK